MGNPNLLNTSTTNFLSLVGNGKVFRVPKYQRDYSWEEEQWDDVWTDILDLKMHPEKFHYMGALVIEGKSDRDFHVIDGQQRLATLSLLALAVISKLQALVAAGIDPDENKARAVALRARFVGEKDPASLVESSKIFLNETDDGFYQDYLVQLRLPRNPRGLPKSNRLLWSCFQYFLKRLDEVVSFKTDGKALAELLSEVVARQLMFIQIVVDDQLSAYTVFETLNARGLELSSTDLLKNYLFSRVTVENDLLALQRRWKALVTTVGQEHFPEFLRYHLMCEHSKVTRQRLFKMVRDSISGSQQVFELVDALEGRAELFSALKDSNHGYWAERPGCKPWIKELNLFRVRQVTPLLFATFEKFNPGDFERVLKLVSVISFRYSAVGGLNPNVLESTYHQAAKEVLAGTCAGPAQVFRMLKQIYVSDEKFSQDFSSFTIDTSGRKSFAKYVLCKIESDRAGILIDPETNPATIEHILPENPTEGWTATFPQDTWEANTYRLGNLSLLEASINRRIGNLEYPEKLQGYRESNYTVNKELLVMAPVEWTLELLNARQLTMASRAAYLWKSDFDLD